MMMMVVVVVVVTKNKNKVIKSGKILPVENVSS
jgi:hypothetical protein